MSSDLFGEYRESLKHQEPRVLLVQLGYLLMHNKLYQTCLKSVTVFIVSHNAMDQEFWQVIACL